MSEEINKNFKGLYDTSKTTFTTDRTEPTHFYEPEVKTPRIKNVSYSINFDKKELYKQIEDLQQKVEQLENENFNIRENIHLERISLPPELTKDKDFMELYDIPSYKDLQQKVEQLEKENDKLNKELGIFQRENDLLKHKLNDIAFGDDSELALRFLRRIGYVGFDEKRKVYINKHNNEPFIWEDEREKDYYLKDEELNEYTQQLEYKVEQLENIKKEAIDYINNNNHIDGCLIKWEVADLLNILNKGDNNGK